MSTFVIIWVLFIFLFSDTCLLTILCVRYNTYGSILNVLNNLYNTHMAISNSYLHQFRNGFQYTSYCRFCKIDLGKNFKYRIKNK